MFGGKNGPVARSQARQNGNGRKRDVRP
jgi:hypothetical protein